MIATDELIAEIKAGLKGVSPGPWQTDTEESDGCYASGEDDHEGYHTSALLDAKGRKIADALNSDAGLIQEEHYEDDCYAWDEQAKRNFEHMANCSPDNIAAVLDRLEAAEAENKRLRGMLGEVKTLIDEYDRQNSDWHFRRTVINSIIDRAALENAP